MFQQQLLVRTLATAASASSKKMSFAKLSIDQVPLKGKRVVRVKRGNAPFPVCGGGGGPARCALWSHAWGLSGSACEPRTLKGGRTVWWGALHPSHALPLPPAATCCPTAAN